MLSTQLWAAVSMSIRQTFGWSGKPFHQKCRATCRCRAVGLDKAQSGLITDLTMLGVTYHIGPARTRKPTGWNTVKSGGETTACEWTSHPCPQWPQQQWRNHEPEWLPVFTCWLSATCEPAPWNTPQLRQECCANWGLNDYELTN